MSRGLGVNVIGQAPVVWMGWWFETVTFFIFKKGGPLLAPPPLVAVSLVEDFFKPQVYAHARRSESDE